MVISLRDKKEINEEKIFDSNHLYFNSCYSYFRIWLLYNRFYSRLNRLANLMKGAKTKRGAIIYQTKVEGDEWFMDSNLQNDVRFDANANLSRNQDGSWSVDSKEQTRLNVWTGGSGDFRRIDRMDTYNHSIIESRGYWYKPSDWKNVEMTGYFKLNGYVNKNSVCLVVVYGIIGLM